MSTSRAAAAVHLPTAKKWVAKTSEMMSSFQTKLLLSPAHNTLSPSQSSTRAAALE
jgi:hypothetical protein